MRLPPLECLRVFEVAGRHESFVKAGDELSVTPAAVAHRVKTLERHLDIRLFVRHHHGVRLNRAGTEYLREIQRILADVRDVTERLGTHHSGNHLTIISIEVFAEKWLMPRLSAFRRLHQEMAIDLHTDHREVDPVQQDFDVWITYASAVGDALIAETLLEESLVPVCSPSLLAARERPARPSDLRSWPLLYDFEWAADWSHWFAHHGEAPPDLSHASGFRLYSMLIQGAVDGMGVAVGHASMISQELESGRLVPLFGEPIAAPSQYLFVTTPASRRLTQVKAFRRWIFRRVHSSGADRKGATRGRGGDG